MHKIDPDYADMADYFLNPLRTSFPLDLLRCYYYDCAPYLSPEPSEDELKRMEVHRIFVENLLSLGRWAIRLGKLQKRWEGQREYYEQKRVDVLLSVDLVRHAAAGHIQHAVLVAGDSDFVPAVEAAKEHGVTVSLWCGHANTVHRDLISLADEVYTFEWGDFPKLNDEPSAGTEGQKKFKKRRRRGGRGRGGARPEGTSDDRITRDPAGATDSDKSTWGDRLKRFTGLK
jgi:uncharacterized LabA/DUF88 family protein